MRSSEVYNYQSEMGEKFTYQEHEVHKPLVVMKFGGTSVGSATAIMETTRFIDHHRKEGNQAVVVVSAMSGITNDLSSVCADIQIGDYTSALGRTQEIIDRHNQVLVDLPMLPFVRLDIQNELDNVYDQLKTDMFTPMDFAQQKDKILSYGERMSARIVAGQLGRIAQSIDSSEIVRTDNTFGNATVDLIQTREMAQSRVLPIVQQGIIPVITGFIGATEDGFVTTLGRNASDYSASVLGFGLGASEVWICKDVYGIYSSDPRKDHDAVFFDYMKQSQAMQFLSENDKVLCLKALQPIYGTNIILRVRNVSDYTHPGTIIIPDNAVVGNQARS